MATIGGPIYNNICEIKGSSGFYQINVNNTPIIVYVDQTYDGGGWICVLANRKNTAGMNNLTYDNALYNINYRTGGIPNSTNTTYTPNHFIGGLDDYNIWIG
jgi:hypothetical protein